MQTGFNFATGETLQVDFAEVPSVGLSRSKCRYLILHYGIEAGFIYRCFDKDEWGLYINAPYRSDRHWNELLQIRFNTLEQAKQFVGNWLKFGLSLALNAVGIDD